MLGHISLNFNKNLTNRVFFITLSEGVLFPFSVREFLYFRLFCTFDIAVTNQNVYAWGMQYGK